MSVGHIARWLEEAGLATVVIGSGVFRDRMAAMKMPRAVITRFPMGRPLGAPGDHETQRKVILAALAILENAKVGGLIEELPFSYFPAKR